MSKERAKGTSFETFIVNYLKNFYPHAERRTLHGTLDKGDITGCDPRLVFECKNHKTLNFSGWLHEAEVERINAGAEMGIVVARLGRSYYQSNLHTKYLNDKQGLKTLCFSIFLIFIYTNI